MTLKRSRLDIPKLSLNLIPDEFKEKVYSSSSVDIYILNKSGELIYNSTISNINWAFVIRSIKESFK